MERVIGDSGPIASSTNSCGTGLRCLIGKRASSSGRKDVLRRDFDMGVRIAVRSLISLLRHDLPQHLSEALNLFYRVVVNQGGSYRTGFGVEPKPSHQPRRVHMADPHADMVSREFSSDLGGGNTSQVEAEGRYA